MAGRHTICSGEDEAKFSPAPRISRTINSSLKPMRETPRSATYLLPRLRGSQLWQMPEGPWPGIHFTASRGWGGASIASRRLSYSASALTGMGHLRRP